MSNFGYTTSLVQDVVRPAPELPFSKTERFAVEEIVPIALIRQHTKTEDVPSVTDEQLSLYARAAVEAAEKYSGLLLQRQRRVEEEIFIKGVRDHDLRRMFRHTLQHPSAEDHVFVYGPGLSERVSVQVGATRILLPNVFHGADFARCCDPCSPRGKTGFRVMYLAGFDCVTAIPAGIIAGILKYIAWMVENPGDVYKPVDNRERTNATFLQGTNNVAWASGALELWRMYANDAV